MSAGEGLAEYDGKQNLEGNLSSTPEVETGKNQDSEEVDDDDKQLNKHRDRTEAGPKNRSKHCQKEKPKGKGKRLAAVKEFEEKVALIRKHKTTAFEVWERQARA
eukprot:767143-Hanusia_phi.AAC.8